MRFLKPIRPTYGPPFGDIDRLLFDMARETEKLSQVRVLGVLIEPTADKRT